MGRWQHIHHDGEMAEVKMAARYSMNDNEVTAAELDVRMSESYTVEEDEVW
ncbi:hypothetical protein TSUD_136630 [Trifolium subterraneum]|uniref:Uncharacterized protein n=1 Tax=Trifolium subterraneum TaxID=3900 RepID=A0A2Z6N9J3_TRISU|nr:hypothetical protein TSUD_136630 [Trifolium subterraneum]